jgi:hypothetical protein
MMRIRLLSLFLGLTLLLPSLAQADITPEKRAEIDKLLRLSGTDQQMGLVLDQMVAILQKSHPDAPLEFWVKFRTSANTHELLELIIPVYDKYYSLEDLKQINAFYESPSGQRMVQVSPEVMKESMQIGQQWGSKLGKQVAEEIKIQTQPLAK